jgi:hypothetical protein
MLQKYIKFCILVLLFSCRTDAPLFSDIPNLTLAKVEQFQRDGKDSSVVITLNYTDGDGDIGLEETDTFPPFNFGSDYFHNLLVSVYRIENGIKIPITIPATTDTLNFNDRIKNLTPTGKIKTISGQIRINLNAKPYPGILPDSMSYKVQIIDRKLNKSNTVETNPLKFTF